MKGPRCINSIWSVYRPVLCHHGTALHQRQYIPAHPPETSGLPCSPWTYLVYLVQKYYPVLLGLFYGPATTWSMSTSLLASSHQQFPCLPCYLFSFLLKHSAKEVTEIYRHLFDTHPGENLPVSPLSSISISTISLSNSPIFSFDLLCFLLMNCHSFPVTGVLLFRRLAEQTSSGFL